MVFSNNSVHLENGRLVVTMVLLRSLRSDRTLNNRSDSYLLKLRYVYQLDGIGVRLDKRKPMNTQLMISVTDLTTVSL